MFQRRAVIDCLSIQAACSAHQSPALLHYVSQLVSKIPLLAWRNIDVICLCVGQCLHLSGFVGIVMHLHAVKGHSGVCFKLLFHLIRNASCIL